MSEIQNVGDLNIDAAEDLSATPIESANRDKKTDSTLSSLQASELVAALFVPFISAPTLIPPAKEINTVQGLGSILASMSERKKMNFLFGIATQMRESTSQLNEIFMQSLEANIEETRRILNSYAHRDQQQFKRESFLPSENSSESDAVSFESKVSVTDKSHTFHQEVLNHLQKAESLSQDIKQVEKIDIPFTVLFTVAGALALGKTSDVNEGNKDIIKLVENLQPVISQVKVEEILPVINLMIMAPIIFRPLDESLQNSKTKTLVDYVKLVQNFAKDVIKMVTDPTFALLNVVNSIEQMEHLTSEQKKTFVALLKLILLSVALSLIYSAEVGKIQGDKFLGMQPLEFMALLDPDKPLIQVKSEQSRTTHDKLVYALIDQVRLQVGELPLESRNTTLHSILSFLEQSKRMDKLLDPAKVLTEVLHSMSYKLPLDRSISV